MVELEKIIRKQRRETKRKCEEREYVGTSFHLNKVRELLDQHDYHNSIKESISAENLYVNKLQEFRIET